MATYSAIQTRVQRRVIDLPSAVTTEVPTLINEAIRELEDAHNFKVMEAIGGPYTTTVSTRVLTAMPSDFKEYHGNPYYIENSGNQIALDLSVLANIQGGLDAYETLDDGEPYFLLEGTPSDDDNTRNWEVYPLPDGYSDYDDGEYRIYVPYWRYLSDLSSDSDTNWFTTNAEEWIVMRATAEAFALDWDTENEGKWLQKAAYQKNRVINVDKRYRLSSVRTLVPRWRGVNSPAIRK